MTENWAVVEKELMKAEEDYKKYADHKRHPEWMLNTGDSEYHSTKNLKNLMGKGKVGGKSI